MSAHWHPDIQVARLEPWLVGIRLVYHPQHMPYTHWPEFNTLRDSLDLGDEPIWVIDKTPEAVDWALDHLRESGDLANVLAHWGVNPSKSRADQIRQLKKLAEQRPDGQSGLDRIYELVTIRRGPFRPWSVTQGLSPYIEVA